MHDNWTISIMIILSKNTHLPRYSIYHWGSQPVYCWSFSHLIVHLGKLNTNIDQFIAVTKTKALEIIHLSRSQEQDSLI